MRTAAIDGAYEAPVQTQRAMLKLNSSWDQVSVRETRRYNPARDRLLGFGFSGSTKP